MPSSAWKTDVCSRSEEHTSELQSLTNLVCRLLLEKTQLREEEKQIKAEIGKCKIRLVEKEQSEAYLRTLKLAIDNFDETKKNIDIVVFLKMGAPTDISLFPHRGPLLS